MLLAKEALMDDIDMLNLKQRGPRTDVEKLRIELHDKVNALGIGAQGLGGLTPCSTSDQDGSDARGRQAGRDDSELRSKHGTRIRARRFRAAYIEPPSLDLWPRCDWQPDYNRSASVNLDTLTKEESHHGRPGQTLLLNGRMLTGRDAAHNRIADMLAKMKRCRSTLPSRVYYVGGRRSGA